MNEHHHKSRQTHHPRLPKLKLQPVATEFSHRRIRHLTPTDYRILRKAIEHMITKGETNVVAKSPRITHEITLAGLHENETIYHVIRSWREHDGHQMKRREMHFSIKALNP